MIYARNIFDYDAVPYFSKEPFYKELKQIWLKCVFFTFVFIDAFWCYLQVYKTIH